MAFLINVLTVLVLIPVYLLPAIIGWRRGQINRVPLLIFNLFFGWTLVGWGAALMWAFWRRGACCCAPAGVCAPAQPVAEAAAEAPPAGFARRALKWILLTAVAVLVLVVVMALVVPRAADMTSGGMTGVPLPAEKMFE